MCPEKIIRRFAGVFILTSLALGWFVDPLWFLFTAFVGVNLLQSSLTNFCPLEMVLGRWGLAGCQRAPSPDATGIVNRSERVDKP